MASIHVRFWEVFPSHELCEPQVVGDEDRQEIGLPNKATQPLPRWTKRLFGLRVKGRSDAPGAHTKESKASQREHPCGRHQTINMPHTRAILPNGHKGTKTTSGHTARHFDRRQFSQVHGHNQGPSSAFSPFHEPAAVREVWVEAPYCICGRVFGADVVLSVRLSLRIS